MAKKDNVWEFEVLASERHKHSFTKPNTWFRLDAAMVHTAKWDQLSLAGRSLWITILSSCAAVGRPRVAFLPVNLRSLCKSKGNGVQKCVRELVDNEWIRVLRSPTPLSTDGRTDGEGASPLGKCGSIKEFEARFSMAPKIKEVSKSLKTMYRGPIPGRINNAIPKILESCDNDVKVVEAALEDLYQSDKIATGEGLTGSHASYLTKALVERFGLDG